ncbi:MBL fold metallo-hydrolase [bacterium]|nr:MBL fold metallo-hydrolase [bacterium]PIV81887.1 MAG: hypothetical protein COW53_01925 [bacterium CG17_big_fil_post_rev_8_21_14_2_50_64_8]PJA73666.1 MAG: hypothetical protein CO151_12660 [bacterium CG_4_9_14_3_um_filter_65_15]
MITFHILGAGGALPTATHNPAAYLVEMDGAPLVLDPGPGALVRMAQAGLLPDGVDGIGHVLLSHLHPDHSLDLAALLFALHSPLPQSRQPVTISGPRGLQNLLDGLVGIYGSWLEPRRRELVIQELQPGDSLAGPGGGAIAAFAVNHPQDRLSIDCLGYRFTDAGGQVAVYSGDTGPSTELETAAHRADLLVIECSTPDELETPGHLCPREVGRICTAARPARVVLTHQYPPAAAMDLAAAVRNHFDGPVVQARDGLVVTIPPANGDIA